MFRLITSIGSYPAMVAGFVFFSTFAANSASLALAQDPAASWKEGQTLQANDAGLMYAAQTISQATTVQATLERTTKTSKYSPPSPDPAGLAYLPGSNTLLISDSEVDEMPLYFTGDNLFEVALSGELIDTSSTIAFSGEPAGVAYNPFNGHLFFSDDQNGRWIYELDPGEDGQYDTPDDVVTQFDTRLFGSYDPEGLAFDSWQGHLFIVDGTSEDVYEIDPGPNGFFEGAGSDDQISVFEVTSLGLEDPEGIEFNPDNGHLYILSGRRATIAETTKDGSLIRKIDISSVPQIAASGLAYAPSSSNPAEMHLYITDRGIDNSQNSKENDGRLFEISFPPLPEPVTGLTVSHDGPTLLGKPTTLMATVSTGDDISYEWNFGDGTPLDSNGSVVSHTYFQRGAFTVVVTASNSLSTESATTLVSVQAPQLYLPIIIR